MWVCQPASKFVYVLISATLITANKEIELESEPCSQSVLRITVHGVVTTNGICNDVTGNKPVSTIDDITNIIVGSVPELSLHVYSVIVCPTTAAIISTAAECLYSIYIIETKDDVTVSSSRLTRASMAALQSEFTQVMIREPKVAYTNMHNFRVTYDIDDMMASGSSGSGDFDAGSSNNRGLKDLHIIIIAVGAFVTLCFTFTCLMSVVQCRKRSSKLGHVEYPPLPITLDGDTDNFELYPLSPQMSKRIYRLSAKEPPLPVLTNLLNMQNLRQMLDDEDAIETEYYKLVPSTISIEHIPDGTVYKNRYVDILPDPRTRVALSLQSESPNSDYINANYIRGYKMTSKQYIATQGPLAETVEDFWRLIWEQRCSTIVMLTNLIENDKIRKCHQYWPDERVNRTSVYGELLVTISNRQTERDYMITTFLVQHRDKAVNRQITHFWFTSWPDHGIPKATTPIIAFAREVRNHQAEIPGPMVVHCSAGIGRTGVFICFDIGMRQLEETNEVDILHIVSVLRQDRGGMIQTPSQYLFVYRLLYDYGCYLQRISSSHLQQLEEFPNDTSDATDDQLETDSQSSLHSDY